MPNVVGQPQADAVATLVGVGLSAGAVTTATSTTVAAGRVISQNPPAATVVAPGASVSLVVSSGSGTVPDPGLPAPWLTQDVGTVGLAGSATFQAGTGTYSVTGAGADIWGTADAFRFVYQPLSGDGQIVARVATVQNTNAWVKAGVMIRTALTSDSAQAMMMVTPGKGNNFQRRTAAGGVSTQYRRRPGDGAVLGEADASRHDNHRVSVSGRRYLVTRWDRNCCAAAAGSRRSGGVEPLDHDPRDGHVRSGRRSTFHNGGLSFALARGAASKEGHD